MGLGCRLGVERVVSESIRVELTNFVIDRVQLKISCGIFQSSRVSSLYFNESRSFLGNARGVELAVPIKNLRQF